MPYCDNLTIFALSQDEADSGLRRAMAAFEEVGFKLHDVCWASETSRPLGSLVSGKDGLVGPRPERLWLLRSAFKWAGQGPKMI
eukprot:7187752-Karenia_brevis.AAC.1